MKTTDIPSSSNIELSCLGKTVPMDSPDGAAAIKCLSDIANIRHDVGQKAVDFARNKHQLGDKFTEDNVRQGGEDLFSQFLKEYILHGEHSQGTSLLFQFKHDSYKDREAEFIKAWNKGDF